VTVLTMTNQLAERHNVLFLLRSHNDIDHIVPIIWKCIEENMKCYYLFTESDHSADHRIKFIGIKGAIRIHSRAIWVYHRFFRQCLLADKVRNVLDMIVGWTMGRHLLDRRSIEIIVTEWSGRSGRGQAKYILAPAFRKHLPIYSVPHGYNIYTNLDINKTVTEYRKKTGKWPDFSARNSFTRYVVQTDATQRFCEAYGIKKSKLEVLGSARFCREWMQVNREVFTSDVEDCISTYSCKIVFFLPQWDYNVDREACYRLILLLSEMKDVLIRLKGSTREISGLYESEQRDLVNVANVVFSNNNTSPSLIEWSDLVINFASSIGLEAVMQDKPILNPQYLHSNETIFDNSGVTIDCGNSDVVLEEVLKFKENGIAHAHKSDQKTFYKRFIQGSNSDKDVLGKYVRLIKGAV